MRYSFSLPGFLNGAIIIIIIIIIIYLFIYLFIYASIFLFTLSSRPIRLCECGWSGGGKGLLYLQQVGKGACYYYFFCFCTVIRCFLILLNFSFLSPLLALLSFSPFLREMTQNDPQGLTCLYSKMGFTGVYIIFLISAQKHRLCVLVRTASARRF